MEIEYNAGFTHDLRRIRNQDLLRRVATAIADLESASSITAVSGAVRMASTSGTYYRLRIGDYRLGFAIEDDKVILVRLLHRREIYRFFP